MTVSINGTSGIVFNDASTQNTAATGFGFKNRILNGAMVIDQRNAGASVTPTTTNTYTLDRWVAQLSASSKFSVQQTPSATETGYATRVGAGFTNYLAVTSLAATSVASGDYYSIRQMVEGFNVADLAWGTASAATVTLSFWVRSSLTGTFGGVISNNAENRSYPFTYTISSANTWEQKTITVAGDTSGTWTTTNGTGLRLIFGLGVGSTYSGTAGAWAGALYLSATGATSVVGTNGATFYITGVQLEKGSTATSFDYRPIGTELQLCQRYFETFKNSSGVTQNLYLGYQIGGGNAWVNSPFVYQVTKRATPTVTTSNLAGSNFTFSAANASENYVSLQFLSASAGNTQVYVLNGNTWLTVSSEL